MKHLFLLFFVIVTLYSCSSSDSEKIKGRWKEIKSIHDGNDVVKEKENIFYTFKDSTCLYFMADREKSEDWDNKSNRYELDEENGILKVKSMYYDAAKETYEYRFNSNDELSLSYYLLPEQKKRRVTTIYQRVDQ